MVPDAGFYKRLFIQGVTIRRGIVYMKNYPSLMDNTLFVLCKNVILKSAHHLRITYNKPLMSHKANIDPVPIQNPMKTLPMVTISRS